MKKRSYLITSAVLLCFLFFTQKVLPQSASTGNAGFENMSFEIELMDKTDYVPLEPVRIKCKFLNKTNEAQTIIPPDFKSESGIEVDFNGERKQFYEISLFRVFIARQPMALQVGKEIEQIITLDTKLDEFFPKPGSYSIRLVVRAAEGKTVESNALEINIVEPEGIDKEALNFIRQNKIHNTYPMLFTWKEDVKAKNGKTLLEEFVSKYSESVYGELAIYKLGKLYFIKGENEKARIEFEKLKFSKNPLIYNNETFIRYNGAKKTTTEEKGKPEEEK